MQPEARRRLLERVVADMDVLDQRLHDIHESDRTEAYRLVHLTTGALAATIAIAGLALERGLSAGPAASGLVAVGVIGLFVAILVLRSGYADDPDKQTLEMGYAPGHALRLLERLESDEENALIWFIRYKYRAAGRNAEIIAARRGRREFGYRLSLGSVAVVATAAALIVGGA